MAKQVSISITTPQLLLESNYDFSDNDYYFIRRWFKERKLGLIRIAATSPSLKTPKRPKLEILSIILSVLQSKLSPTTPKARAGFSTTPKARGDKQSQKLALTIENMAPDAAWTFMFRLDIADLNDLCMTSKTIRDTFCTKTFWERYSKEQLNIKTKLPNTTWAKVANSTSLIISTRLDLKKLHHFCRIRGPEAVYKMLNVYYDEINLDFTQKYRYDRRPIKDVVTILIDETKELARMEFDAHKTFVDSQVSGVVIERWGEVSFDRLIENNKYSIYISYYPCEDIFRVNWNIYPSANIFPKPSYTFDTNPFLPPKRRSIRDIKSDVMMRIYSKYTTTPEHYGPPYDSKAFEIIVLE